MAALTTLLTDAKLLSRADKLKLIQLLAEDLARASAHPVAGRLRQMPSPRLANPAHAADFVKQVREVAADAAV